MFLMCLTFLTCQRFPKLLNAQKQILLEDGYANDTSVLFMTGMPMNIAPGKNAVGGFLFGYANLGFESIEDIKKLEFKISFRDKETYDELFKTNTIQLDF